MKSFRSFLSLGLIALSLTACGQNLPMRPTQMQGMQSLNAPVRAQATARAPHQDPALMLPVLKDLYKELADSIEQGKPTAGADQLMEQHGPAAFALLGKDASARQQLYPYSDQMVMREYNKPSPADNVAPISAAELQGLTAKLKPGDLILCGNDRSFVHGALYIGQGQIIHSLATQPDMHDRFRGVVQESLAVYTARSERDTFVVLRPKSLAANPNGFAKALNYARAQVGKGYDSLFLNASEERFYCTELLFKALRLLPTPPRMQAHKAKYGWEMVTVEDLMDSPDFETIWTRNKQRPAVGQLHRY